MMPNHLDSCVMRLGSLFTATTSASWFLLTAYRSSCRRDEQVSNGARVERVNWMADSSSRGIENSFGVMVNYV